MLHLYRKRLSLLLLSLVFSPLIAVCEEQASVKPNIIFILTDDMTYADLAYMSKTNVVLTRRGASFQNFYVTDSLCCPSRTSILRGQYVHNHGVMTNDGPLGGFRKFQARDLELSTIGTWLQQAGYHTGL